MICAPQFGIKPVPRMAASNPAKCPAHLAARLNKLKAEAKARAEALKRQAPGVWA